MIFSSGLAPCQHLPENDSTSHQPIKIGHVHEQLFLENNVSWISPALFEANSGVILPISDYKITGVLFLGTHNCPCVNYIVSACNKEYQTV